MLKQWFAILFVFTSFICFSQNTSLYEKAINEFESEAYQESLENFKLAKQQFISNNETYNVVNCLFYISTIKNLQSDFKSSITNSDEALLYIKKNKIVNDSLYSELMSIKTLNLKYLGKYNLAYTVSDSLIKYLKTRKGAKKYLAKAYQIKSRVEIDLGNYDNAIKSAKKALVHNQGYNPERKAGILNIIGVGFYFKEKLDSASYYYNESYKIKLDIKADNYQLAIATCNIGIVQEMLGNYDEAISLYNKSVQYDLLDRGEDVGILSDVYVALSNTYFKKNDLEKAEEFANKALRIAIKKYGEDSPKTSFVYVSYANIFELKGDYEKNIEYIKKALSIRRKTYGNMHRWTAENLLSISESQVEIERYTEAEKNYKEAISIANYNKNNLVMAYAEMGLGNLYTKTNQYDLAIDFIEASKTKFIKNFGEFHGTHLSVLVLEAENYYEKEEPLKALEIIELIKSKTKNSNLFYRLDAITLELDIALNYFEETGRTDYLKKCLDTIDETKQMLFSIRKDYPTSKSKIHINNSMYEFVAKAIKASYVLYSSTKDFTYVEKAFELSEFNRSSALVSGIQDVRFKKMANVPEVLLEKENELNHKLASLKKDIYYEENEEAIDVEYMNELLSKQLTCRATLDSLLTKIETEFPKYYQLKYSNTEVGINELQQNVLKNDEVIIEYFLAEDHVYVFTISKSKRSFKKLSKTANIQSILKKYRDLLNKREDISQHSKTLYNLLLKDLNIESKRLIIIPDKELNHLPFEALMNNDTYLVEKYIISYSGSASLLQTQKEDFFNFEYATNWSGFSPNFNANQALPSSKKEIESVAKLMKGNMFLGDNATIKNFKNATLNSSIIHLATHADIDAINPLYSKLIFAQDSVLTASDIYTLKINAELAVLSACETGFGKLEKSEGVMSLSRAFQYAGVSSTVMSLWKVSDQETSVLMKSFYTYLKSGYSKDEALRKAKIEYLETIDNIDLKHPFYWSGFVISGDMSAIDTSSNIWLFLSLPIIIMMMIFSRKKIIKHFSS